MSNTEARVIEIIEKLSSSGVESYDQKLKDDLGLDSLNTVILIVTVEETFEIELQESDMNPAIFNTVGDIVNLVNRYVEAKE